MRTAIGIVGFLLGIALALLVLLLNPVLLTQPRPVLPAGAVSVLGWEAPAAAGMPLTPMALLGMHEPPERFAEPGIRHARVEVAAIAGENGAPPALLVRLSGLSRQNSLLGARLATVTQTSIIWPGRGSLFLAGSENLWVPLRAGFWSALRGRGFRPAADSYVLPPLAAVAASAPPVIGATGAYASAQGSYRETLVPDGARPGDLAAKRSVEITIR